MSPKPKVAFVCVHNSCRSQIAEALGKLLAADVFDSYSAGTQTRPHINQDAVRLMKQLYGVDMEQTQRSTVSKYIQKLIERGLIAVEPTKVTTKAGVTRNGTLQFTVLPPQDVIAQHYARKLEELELETERQQLQKILAEQDQNDPCAPL